MHDEHPGDTSAGPAETAAETVGNGGGIERKSASADPFGRRRSIFLKFLGIGIVLGLPLVGLTFLLMLDTESGTGLIPCQGMIRYYEKSLAIKLKTLGAEHPSFATTYHLIGVSFYNKGEKRTAMRYLLKAKAIRLKRLGPNHPHTKLTQGWIDGLNSE